jgi:antitoxin (DNA-binding transcriptional repressor) of toxin-antitoxin stability system
MKQIDLDDLPPRIATVFSGLEAGEELVCAQGGLVVVRLTAAVETAPAASAEQPPEERMAEVLEQFNAMIHDEF